LRTLAPLVAIASLTACGGSSGVGKLTLELSEGSEIHAKGDQISSVFLLAFGGKGTVTFTVTGAPSYVGISGDVMTIAPSRSDAGNYPMTVTATDAVTSDSKNVILVIDRANSPPTFVTASAADGRGANPYLEGCLDSVHVWGTMADLASEQDALRVEVELVPGGLPFTGVPTHVSPLSRAYRQGRGDLAFLDYRLELTGVVSGQPYRLAMRAADEFGASSDWIRPTSGVVLGNLETPDTFSCTPFALLREYVLAQSVGTSMVLGAARGTQQAYQLEVDGVPGGAVTFSVSGVPYVSTSESTMTLSPPSDAVPGNAYVQVTAAASGLTATAYYLLYVW